MKVLNGYRDVARVLVDPVLAIGIFDGVHLGHRKVIGRMMNSSSGRDKAILTFDPHPTAVLRPHMAPPRIMSLSHRLRLFELMGLDAAVVLRFSDHIAGMSPEDFVEKVIVEGIGSQRVFVGANFNFGKDGSGNTTKFRKIGKNNGVAVDVVAPVKRAGRIVSSTWVRELVAKGKIKEAEKLLCRPVSVLGTVVSGDSIGRVIGVPTANIDPHHEVIPPVGVYAVRVDMAEGVFPGVLNMGYKPTFYGRSRKRKEPVIETHLIGYDGDLYGRDIEVFFVKKLRSEKRFATHEKLKVQIEKDIKDALNASRTFLRKTIH